MITFCENCRKPKKADEGFCPACGATSVPGVLTRASVGIPSPTESAIPPAAAGATRPNVAGTLCYVFGVISGLVFLLLEPHKRDRFVRFHAFQSIFFSLGGVLFWIVWGTGVAVFEAITGGFLLWLIIPVDLTLTLLVLGSWIFVMLKAYGGVKQKLPVIGNVAERQANK